MTLNDLERRNIDSEMASKMDSEIDSKIDSEILNRIRWLCRPIISQWLKMDL